MSMNENEDYKIRENLMEDYLYNNPTHIMYRNENDNEDLDTRGINEKYRRLLSRNWSCWS